jgi:hypothetical protein
MQRLTGRKDRKMMTEKIRNGSTEKKTQRQAERKTARGRRGAETKETKRQLCPETKARAVESNNDSVTHSEAGQKP